MRVQFLALLSGLRIWCCHELWCRSQTLLRSRVAVALVQAKGYSSDSTTSLGTYIYHGCGPKKTKKKKKTLTNITLADLSISLYITHPYSLLAYLLHHTYFGPDNKTNVHFSDSLAASDLHMI